MTAIALLIAANIASNAPDRRADAHLYDIQLDILRRGFRPARAHDRARPLDGADGLEALRRASWSTARGTIRTVTRASLRRWIASRRSASPCFNSPATVRWNIRKTYLREFEARGVPIIPTLWPEQPVAEDIRERHGRVRHRTTSSSSARSAAAPAARRATPTPTCRRWLDPRPARHDPALSSPSIATEGEYSFLFVDGEFSHALVKRASAGRLPHPGSLWRQVASGRASAPRTALRPAPCWKPSTNTAHARVDMVRGADGTLLLMELGSDRAIPFPERRAADRRHARQALAGASASSRITTCMPALPRLIRLLPLACGRGSTCSLSATARRDEPGSASRPMRRPKPKPR